MSRMMSTPCTVISEVPTGEKDRHGDPITETVEIETKCALQPHGRERSSEHEGAGEVSDTFWLLLLPWGTDIGTSSMIRVDDREYEVVGEAWNAQEGTRTMWHVEASVRRRAGTGES